MALPNLVKSKFSSLIGFFNQQNSTKAYYTLQVFCMGFGVFWFWGHFYIVTLVAKCLYNQGKHIKNGPKMDKPKT